MNIVCYFINWNDSFYIPFLHKHYSKFCSKIIMYDNHSSDNSVDICKLLGIEVRTFGKQGELNDLDYLHVKNHCWKEQRGNNVDYVILIDADEFLFPDILKGTAPIVNGYDMVSEELPVDSLEEINTGVSSVNYSKQCIFNPDSIEEINYNFGCHSNNIQGNIIRKGRCRLLHYRNIGGVVRLLQRHEEYKNRMSLLNKVNGLGVHYTYSNDKKISEWNELKNNSKKLW